MKIITVNILSEFKEANNVLKHETYIHKNNVKHNLNQFEYKSTRRKSEKYNCIPNKIIILSRSYRIHTILITRSALSASLFDNLIQYHNI